MKKIKKFLVRNSVERLSSIQMCSILGSSDTPSYHYFLRCNQDSSEGTDVSDCSTETAERICGKNANWICSESYY